MSLNAPLFYVIPEETVQVAKFEVAEVVQLQSSVHSMLLKMERWRRYTDGRYPTAS